MQTKTPEEMSQAVHRAETTDAGRFAVMITDAMKDDPTGLLRGQIVDFYSTVSATGFVIESDLDGERYDVRVSKA